MYHDKTFIPVAERTSADITVEGKDALASAAFLTREGLVKDSDLRFLTDLPIGTRSPADYTPSLRVVDIAYLPSREDMYADSRWSNPGEDLIKRLVMTKGAVEIGYSYQDDVTTDDDENELPEQQQLHYTSVEYNSFFTNQTKMQAQSNHEVLIVGWDDSFPKEHFADEKPSRDGAWLIRNSWGSDAEGHDGGYFWMSYDQAIDTGAAYTVEMPNPELKLYNHDDLGWILSWGEGSTTAWGASVFKSGTGSESVKEIAFYTTDNNASYELFVYDLGTTAPTSPTAGARVASKSGSFELAGYHTVAVEAESSIAAGHYFSVVLKLTNPTTDSPVAASGKVQYISDGAVINAGEGYVSADGASWTDGVNIEYTFTGTVTPQNLKGIAPCVKVFTVAAEDTPEPTSTPTQTPTGGGNSSSGCDAGLLGVAGLGSIILATGLALRGKRK